MNARTDLFRVEQGTGETVVLVHGSWTDHSGWSAVQSLLASRRHVVAYDRRGHSRSGPADGLGSRRVHEDDLVALIEHLGVGPVDLVGNSFGGSIVLGVAARRADLVRSVAAHEPPLVGLAGDDRALAPALAPVLRVTADVGALVRAGHVARAAQRFVEELVLGAGAWSLLPDAARTTMVANSATYLEMLDDAGWADAPSVDPNVPMLVTTGDMSPTWFIDLARALGDRHPHAARRILTGAGHVPHLTDPEQTASCLLEWFAAAQVGAAPGR
jgi:pimeloyl-ACP methyl ester carboxylesterase